MKIQQLVTTALVIGWTLSFLPYEALAQPAPPKPLASSNLNATGVPMGKNKIPFYQANPEDITDENYPDLIESFDYPNADISEVITAISKLTGKRFILDNNVRGKITIISPTPITVAEAYRAFLSALAMNGLTVIPSGEFLKIRQARAAQTDSIETYAGGYFPNTDQIITRIVKLKYISAEEINKSLRQLGSKDGNLSTYGPTNSLIITDFGSNIERIMGILNQLDVPGFEEKLSVIRIRYAKSKDIASLIDQIINKGDKTKNQFGGGVPRFRRAGEDSASGGSGAETYSLVVSDDRTNSIIVVGNDAGIQKIKGLVAKLDFRLRPEDAGGVQVYYVRFGEAEKIANVLNGIASDSEKAKTATATGGFTGNTAPGASGPVPADAAQAIFGGNVKVIADKDTNSLVITAGSQDYVTVKAILAKLDIPRDQVFVKAIIMEMSADVSNQWGVSYYKFAKDTNGVGRIGFSSGNLADMINPLSDAGAILGFGDGDTVSVTAGNQKFDVKSLTGFVKFLKKNLNGNVLSTPQIMAMDNEQASIEVGQTVPVGASTSTTGSTTTQSVNREKATIKLEITPFISPDSDSVRLKIVQQVKQLTKQKVEQSQLAEAAVVTNDREIKTTVVVDSGNTAVLGGLMSDREEEDVLKVPILGDIPILGWLFKSKSTSKVKSNLVVFITPKIVRSNLDNSDILNAKLNERVDFIQRNMSGRDPHGYEIDNLPRKALIDPATESFPSPEEPAAETF